MKFNILVQTNIFRWFPASPTYSHLGTVSSGHGLYFIGTCYRHIQVWNPDSLGHGMESGWCRLHCSPFCRARLLELWYRVLRSSSVPVTHEGYLVESRRPLWFGSSQANCSIFNTLSWHFPLAAVSRSTSITSLRFGSSASHSSPFSSSCYVGSHCSAFLSC